MKNVYYLYDGREVGPYVVRDVRAFCEEMGLRESGIRNVLRGLSKQYRGWHLDEQRTQRLQERMRALEAALAQGALCIRLRDAACPPGGLTENARTIVLLPPLPPADGLSEE
jgi:hypothetical protein